MKKILNWEILACQENFSPQSVQQIPNRFVERLHTWPQKYSIILENMILKWTFGTFCFKIKKLSKNLILNKGPLGV